MLTTGQIKSGIGNIMAALSTGSGLAPAWKMRNEFMVPDGGWQIHQIQPNPIPFWTHTNTSQRRPHPGTEVGPLDPGLDWSWSWSWSWIAELQAPHVRALFWFTLAAALFIDACDRHPVASSGAAVGGSRLTTLDLETTSHRPTDRPPTAPSENLLGAGESLSLFNLANLYTPSGHRS